MSRMLKSDWISKIGQKRKSRLDRGKKQLSCEPLEDRRVLAVVMNGLDAGAGSLRDAVATGDASITFDAAVTAVTLTSGEIAIGNAVTIDGPGVTITNTAAGSRIFNASAPLELSGVTLTGGDSTGAGGAVYSTADVTLRDATISGNSAGTDGGGLRVVYSNMYIYDSLIDNNFAADDGGGFEMTTNGQLTIDGSTISNNTAGALIADGGIDGNSTQGGGFRVFDGNAGTFQVDITDSFITGNEAIGETGAVSSFAAGGGAAIRDLNTGVAGVNTSRVSIDNTMIANNSAFSPDVDPADTVSPDARGGGLYLSLMAEVNVTNSTIQDNYSYDNGSGVAITSYQNETNVTIDNTTITSNGDGADVGQAGVGGNGGGLWIIPFGAEGTQAGISSTITNSTITDNLSAFGSNLTLQQGGTHNVSDTVISGGTGTRGGGLYAFTFAGSFTNNVTLDRVAITGNTSSISGGGVRTTSYDGGTNNLTINNSTISGNAADQSFGAATPPADDEYAGGGLDLANVGFSLYQSTVSGNTATGFGGGIRISSSVANSTIDRSTITLNDATGVGTYAAYNAGGVYAYNGNSVDFTNSIVSGNTQNGGVDVSDVYQGYMSGGMTEMFSIIGSDQSGLAPGAIPVPGIAGGALVGTQAAPVDAMLNGLASGAHLPMAGSPAIDAGDPAVVGGTDQLGLNRVNDGQMDIGSVETGNVTAPDINIDGLGGVDCDDLILLSNAIAAGSTDLGMFDFDGSGVIDAADGTEWLMQAGVAAGFTNDGYLAGDADLNGSVDGTDFLTWNANKFTATADGPCAGDFNFDGVTDGSDFLVWNGNKFTTATVTTSDSGLSADGLVGEARTKFGAGISHRMSFVHLEEGVGANVTRTPIAAPAAVQVSLGNEAGTEQLKAVETTTRATLAPVAVQQSTSSLTDSSSTRDDSEESKVDSVFADLGSEL